MIVDKPQILTFDPVHFLKEAIADFLASGAQPKKIASAVIKVAIGVELILKDKLERICPALILENNPSVFQIVKAFDLGKHLINPAEAKDTELITAKFDTLLGRAAKFIDLSEADVHLRRLQKIRNSLVHHKGEIDMWQTNLLLVKHIFPFLQKLGESDVTYQLNLPNKSWEEIKKIEKVSTSAFSSQLAKKIAHFRIKGKELTGQEVSMRIESEPVDRNVWDDLIHASLICPACTYGSLAAFGGFEELEEDDGFWHAYYVVMDCRVCELEIDHNEIGHIIENFSDFFDESLQGEKAHWQLAVTPPTDDYGFTYR